MLSALHRLEERRTAEVVLERMQERRSHAHALDAPAMCAAPSKELVSFSRRPSSGQNERWGPGARLPERSGRLKEGADAEDNVLGCGGKSSDNKKGELCLEPAVRHDSPALRLFQ
jgi:hypothetical protein